MLYIFALAGTLVAPFATPADTGADRVVVLPGRAERIVALREAGHQIAIVTNHGGVAFGMGTERQFQTKLAAALRGLGLPRETIVKVCFADRRSRNPKYNDAGEVARRKPSGDMFLEVMHELDAEDFETIAIGNHDEDEQAALNANVAFIRADAFFAPAP